MGENSNKKKHNQENIATITEKELLEKLMHYAIGKNKKNEHIVTIVLENFPNTSSLLCASEEILRTLHLWENTQFIEFIRFVREFVIRFNTLPYKTKLTKESFPMFAEMMRLRIGYLDYEVIQGILFNKDKRFIALENMALGSVNSAIFDVKTIIDILKNTKHAHYLLLFHNHPSGICKPSVHDIETTKLIARACIESSYTLLDHCIVTYNTAYSMYSHSIIIEHTI